jgi:hypothetical protein
MAYAVTDGMVQLRRLVAPLYVLFAGAACAPERARVETSAAVAPARQPNEVRFELKVGERHAGRIVVRSTGAYLGHVEAEQQTVIDVALEIENAGTLPILLDGAELRLSHVRTPNAQLAAVAPSGSSGRADVLPGGKQTARAHFVLPPDITPAGVQDYDLTWVLREPGGVEYRLTNSFVQDHGTVFMRPAYESKEYPYYHYDGATWHYGAFGPAWPHTRLIFVPHYGREGDDR